MAVMETRNREIPVTSEFSASEKADFALSRIYAQGWTAGRVHDGEIVDLETTVASLNPYKTTAEKERWAAGFQDAMHRAQARRGNIVR